MAVATVGEGFLHRIGLAPESWICRTLGLEFDRQHLVFLAGGPSWQVMHPSRLSMPLLESINPCVVRSAFLQALRLRQVADGLPELSLTVPITNSLAFLFTVLGEWYAEGKLITRDTWAGMLLVCAGIALCVYSKL